MNRHLSFQLKRAALLTFACFCVFSTRAEDASTAFSEANRLFERQNFREAAAAYERLTRDGKNSAALQFNLGNAWFKAGEVGKAIAAYRAAARISPRDPDVRANLSFARETVQNSKPPRSNLWTQLLDRLSLNEWSVLAASLLAVTFLLLAFGQWRREWVKTVRFYATITGAVTVLVTVCAVLAAQRHFNLEAVIAVDEAVARRGPFDESQSAFTLRDGAELAVLDQRDNWVQVADTSNRIGWVRDKQIVLIP